jgi:hypothetical protein
MCEKVAKISIIFQNVKFAKSSHPAYRTNGGSKMLLYDKIMYFRLLVCLHEPWFSVLDATAASDTPQKNSRTGSGRKTLGLGCKLWARPGFGFY